MHSQRINISLPIEIARSFRRIVPTRSRSKFIADALEEKLSQKKDKKVVIKRLKANSKLYDQNIKEWELIEVEKWPE